MGWLSADFVEFGALLPKADGDKPEDFMRDEFYAACDCVIDRYATTPVTPSDCVVFDRRSP